MILLGLFIVIPIAVSVLIKLIGSKFEFIKNKKKQILLFINLFVFIVLVLYATNHFDKKLLVLAFGLAVILGISLSKFIMKIVRFQLLLAIIGFIFLVPILIEYLNLSEDWKTHNDAIEDARFTSKPNIYFIQPDGYIGTSEIKKGHYMIDNYKFDTILQNKGFKVYPDFRSNYFSTLSSNSAIFSMKHHFYNSMADTDSEMLRARKNILGHNTVLSVLHQNNYKTHAILESPYLMVSRPKLYFNTCNIDYRDVSYLSNGFDLKKNVLENLKTQILDNKEGHHFYFIEKMLPGHIANLKSNSKGKEKERLQYLEKLDAANTWLKDIIALIQDNDNNALIIIAADHGGFVGFEYSSDAHIKTDKLSDLNSVFSTLLAIKWTGDSTAYDDTLKSSVNLFRVVFSFLSEDKTLLDDLEENSSYLTIDNGAPVGIYKVLNKNGKACFEKH
jgi:hypothetical protein